MRRTNEAPTQHLSNPEESCKTFSSPCRVLALLLLAAMQSQSQEKNGRGPGTAPATRPKAERRIVISIPDHKLALIEDGGVVKIYPVAVGAAFSPSPAGEFRIRERITAPTYYAPGKVIPPGNANPLGTRWIGLGHRGYGIHGTNEPRSIGKSASHGCIRMRNHDVEELFELVRTGDVVEFHAERTEAIALIFGGSSGVPEAKPATTADTLGGL